MDLILGFTGTREGLTEQQDTVVWRLLEKLEPVLVVHGGCTGADERFDQFAHLSDVPRRIYPASNVQLRYVMRRPAPGGPKDVEWMDKAPAPGRNRFIIEDSHVMIACPKDDKMPHVMRGQGTWTAVKWSRDALKPLYLILPTGITLEERMAHINQELQARANEAAGLPVRRRLLAW